MEPLEGRLCLAAELGFLATSPGPSNNDGFNDLEIDAAGNMYVSSSEFLAKLSPQGSFLWGVAVNGITRLDLDGAGNIYALGELGSVNVAGVSGNVALSSQGLADVFVLKFNPSGLAIWGRGFGTAAADQVPRGLAVDAAGNAVVTGYFSGTWTLGADTLVSAGQRDGFITRISPAGDLQWSRQIGGTGDDDTWDVDLDSSGNAYVTGTHTAQFTLPGGIVIPVVPGSNAYVAKVSPQGNFVWGAGFGAGSIHALAVDPAGYLLLTGGIVSTMDLDPGPGDYPLTGDFDQFLLKLDLNGQFVWARLLTGTLSANDLVIGSAGQVHVTGIFSGTIDVAPQRGGYFLSAKFAGTATSDPWVATFDAQGDLVAARSWGGIESDVATALVADTGGRLYVAGYFRGTANLSPNPTNAPILTTSNGAQDGFLLRLDPPSSMIAGRVWNDVTPNGLQDANEVSNENEVGLAGVVLELRSTVDVTIGNGDDSRVAIVTTNATGNYRFDNLPSGFYYLVARTPVGRVFTTPNAGNDASDSDLLTTGLSDLLILDPATQLLHIDTGLQGGAPGFGYAVRAGSPSGQSSGNKVAVDADGNSYVAGYFTGTVDFDPSLANTFSLTSSSNSNSDAFVAKYSTTGALVWVRAFGSANLDSATAVAVNAAGEIYVSGIFGAAVDLDPGPLTRIINTNGAADIFVVKLTSDGDLIWSKTLGSSGQEGVGEMLLDAAGNLVLGGSFFGTVDFNPVSTATLPLTSAGNSDAFILRLSAAGNFLSAVRFGGTNAEELRDLDLDANGNLYTFGIFRDTADMDPTAAVFNLTSAGGADAFTTKLNADGTLAWAVRQGNANSDIHTYALRVDSAGNVYTAGAFSGSVDFGGVTLSSGGLGDAYLAKRDGNGQLVWARQLSGASEELNSGLDVDAAGNVYVAGRFYSTARFIDPAGEYLYGASTSQNAYVAKVSPAGFLQTFYLVAATNNIQGYGVTVDRVSGRIHLTGTAVGAAVDFDPGPTDFYTYNQSPTGDFYLAQFHQVARARMTLSSKTITENQSLQLVGALGVSSGLPGETFTFSLGGVGAAGFSLGNDLLYANTNLFNYESSSQTTVQVQATGSFGTQLSQVFYLTVLDANEAPGLFNIVNLQADPGVLWQVSGNFSDPDQGDSWTATVNYGDGAGPGPLSYTPSKSYQLSHTYASGGVYTVTVSFTDAAGLNATKTYSVIVRPPITVQGPPGGVAGEPLSFQASLGGVSLPGNHSVVWNFGDGTSPIGLAISSNWQNQTHVFTAPGTYNVTARLQLSDGRTSLATWPVTIVVTEVRTDPADPNFQTLLIGGTEDSDLIRVLPAGTTGVRVWNRGDFLGTFAGIDRVIVQAQAGNDYVLGAAVGQVEMRFFGGNGDDVLIGTSSDDVLVGDGGNDILQGGAGRDLLIGGFGSDSLHGQDGQDILIGGQVFFPNLNNGLAEIRNEWSSPRTLAERVTNLQVAGPQAAGTLLLKLSTVQDDIDPDSLFGDADADWYFADSNTDRSHHVPGTDVLNNEGPPVP